LWIRSPIEEIAEEAYQEEDLPWTISAVSPNPKNKDEWEIYYDAWGKKYHKILVRLALRADSTRDSLKTEVRDFLRSLKESGRL
jgi:hypothetical protein